jgi:Ner family transcriptional regulator
VGFWTSHTILAEVRGKGISLRRLSLARGMAAHTLTSTLHKPNSKGEQIIAEFLGVPAHKLWPERYLPSGQRRRPQPRKNYSPARHFGAPIKGQSK